MFNKALSSSESHALKYLQQNPSGFIHTIWMGIMYFQSMATRGREVTVPWDPLWSANGKSGIGIHSPSFWGLDARETVSYKSPCAALLGTETPGRMQMSPAQLAMVRAAPELVKDGRLAESRLCMRSDWGSFKVGPWTLQVSSSSSVILSGSRNPVTQKAKESPL